MASSNKQSLDPDFIRLGLAVVIAVAGLWIIEQVNPRLGNWYIAAVLLGVVLTHRAGVENFLNFLTGQMAAKG